MQDNTELEEIGGYRIINRLENGHMGISYKVKDENGNSFFLKTISTETSSEDRLLRFEREIDALKDLNHQNIPKLLDDGH